MLRHFITGESLTEFHISIIFSGILKHFITGESLTEFHISIIFSFIWTITRTFRRPRILKGFVCLSVWIIVRLSVCPSVRLSIYLSVCLFVCLSVCLFVCLSVCLFVCLSVCLFVCLSVWDLRFWQTNRLTLLISFQLNSSSLQPGSSTMELNSSNLVLGLKM